MGHDKAFGRRVTRPTYLQRQAFDVTSAWTDALNALTDERLAEALGDVLPQRELTAVGRRRDMLLEDAAN